MSNFYPPQFDGEIVTISILYVWYIILVDGTDVGTIWLEKEKLHDSIVSLGIMIGHSDKLGIGLGQQVIPLAIELARTKLKFEGVQLRVRKTNFRAIGCYKKCGFSIIGEGTYINKKAKKSHFLKCICNLIRLNRITAKLPHNSNVLPPAGLSTESSLRDLDGRGITRFNGRHLSHGPG